MEEEEELATTVLTCEGDITDPAFPFKLQHLVTKLQHLISDEKPIQVTKVEPWNSVRVTFNIPQEAAQRLRQLAERGDTVLRELGILSVQIEGDQVITLTLAGQFNEPQEIVLRKTNESQDGVSGLPFSLPASESVAGPSSAEPSHKNINQFLGHIVGGAAASSASVSSSKLSEQPDVKAEPPVNFRSPNVIAPSSAEPIPFLSHATAVTTVSTTGVLRVTSNTSGKTQPGFGPFPFASMTHAMNTKHGSLSPQYQPAANVGTAHPHLLLTTANVHNTFTNSSVTSLPVTRPQTVPSPSVKKGTPVSHSVFNNIVSRVSTANSVVPVTRANVALSSPLLVNLLQSETSNIQGHNKLMPPPTLAANQGPKRKRKSRKEKNKVSEDVIDSTIKFSTAPSSPSVEGSIKSNSPSNLTQSYSIPLSNISQSPSSTSFHQITKAKSSVQVQSASIHPQAQGQPPVSMHVQLQGQPPLSKRHHLQGLRAISTIRQPATVPNIHPQAQGQPQVHTGNLPLHSHIPVGSPQVARPPATSVQTYAMSATHTVSANSSRVVMSNKDRNLVVNSQDKLTKSNVDVKSGEKRIISTASHDSTSDSNPFPSPPSSGDGKTKHLINPFTGQLEPMPSDDDEEDESIGSLPPFPEFEIDTSENGQSEKSLSDGGKENNHSSDTDSGISKSHTDISQSSTECGPVESGQENKKHETASCKSEATMNPTVMSSVPVEKLKLRLKLDHKTLRESKEAELKEKRKDGNPQLNQKIDVAVVNIPTMRKNVTIGSTPVEPRVPPLHISLRGPNSAVVVSPRKDDAKSRFLTGKDDHPGSEAFTKVPPKKIRSPRSLKASESLGSPVSAASRVLDSLDRKAKCSSGTTKRNKDDYWSQNMKNMSGGGIVEMSEKLSSVQCYETYLSDITLGSSMQKKGSPSVQNSCKSEVITLTSCATGESVSIHAAGNAESSLPFHVVVGSENSSVVPVTSQHASASNVQSSHGEKLPKGKQIGSRNHLKEMHSLEYFGADSRSKKDSTVITAPRRSQQFMQKSSLPHSSGGNFDSSKKTVQEAIHSPCDQFQQTSANCVPLVPPSSQAVCIGATESSITSVVTSVSDQKAVSVSSDAKKLSSKEIAGDSKLATNSKSIQASSGENQSNNQCNISSVNVFPEVSHSNSLDLLKIQNVNVFSNSLSDTLCSKDDNVNTRNEVQIKTSVNMEKTANHFDMKSANTSNDHADVDVVNSVTERPKVSSSSEQCKNAVFSTFIGRCRSPLANFMSVSKREIIKEAVGTGEKGVCVIEVKKPPIAQIITVDKLPIQSHVIEVPSLPDTLSKSDLSLEIGSIPSLIPSDQADSFMLNRKQTVVQESESSVLGGESSPESSKHADSDDHLVPLQSASLTCRMGTNIFTSGYLKESTIKAEESVAERNSSAVASEESSMDSIDEERKRCMLDSDVKTSTPGPPNDDKSSKSSCSDLSSSEDAKNISVESLFSTKVEKPVGESMDSDKEIIKQPTHAEVKASACSPDDIQKSSAPAFEGIHKVIKLHKSEPEHSTESISSSSTSEKSLGDSSGNICLKSNSAKDALSSQSVESSSCNKAPYTKAEVQNTETLVDSSSESSSKSASVSQVKPTLSLEQSSAVCSSSSLAVTSFVPQGHFQSPEINPSGRVRLIFKGSAPHSVLSSCNSPTSFVLPLNSTKTVPIKLVTLPGGAAGLSVRSTSNPNVVEIVGPNTASAHVTSSGSIHRSSPVRLVVSKVPSSVTSANQGSVANARSRVVVKSVVVSGTSSSLKLSPAKSDLCSTLPVSTISSVIATAPTGKVTSSSGVHDSVFAAPTTVQQASKEKVEITPSVSEAELRSNVVITTQSETNSAIVQSSVPKVSENSSVSSPLASTISLPSDIDVSKTENSMEEDKCSNTETNDVKSLQTAQTEKPEVSLDSADACHVPQDITDKPDSFSLDNISEACDVQNEISKSVPLNDQLCQETKYDVNNAVSPTFSRCANEQDINLNSVSDLSSILLSGDSLQEQPYLVAKEITIESDVSVMSEKHCSSVIKKCNTDCFEEVLLDQTFLFDSLENEICLSPKIATPEQDSLEKVEQQLIRPKIEDDDDDKFCINVSESEESNLIAKDAERNQLAISLVYPKPVKRKCSENAAELIKACMGVEDGPKRGLLLVPEVEPGEVTKCEKLDDDTIRMNLRVKRDSSARKMRGILCSDCSSDEELTLNELMAKSRMRERSSRNRLCVGRNTPTEAINSRPGRRRSGSNESLKNEDIKMRSKDVKRDVREEENLKKLPERTKRGVNKSKGQTVQRNVYNADSEVKSVGLNIREESKRKTRSTGNTETAEVATVKRRRYSKDGHR